MTASELLDALNAPQRQAVTAGAGPVLVLAGPGSGKTRVLTHRMAYLVGVAGVEPWRIMAVTFTNKAAREMRQRAATLLGHEALSRVTLGTFHAICARILRVEGQALGRNADFVIFDDADQMQVVKRALEDLRYDPQTEDPRRILGDISRAKNELIAPSEYRPSTYHEEIAGRVYAHYQDLLHASNALDFDDLLMQVVRAAWANPEVLARYRRRYRHVLVDEFQDTNTAQYVLVKELVGARVPDMEQNVFVVGDEDQSIYRWRGADYRNIDRFRADFADACVILLEQNYRSTQTILDAARAVISRNQRRTPKRLWTDAGAGEPITLFDASNGSEEVSFVVGQIRRAVAAGGRLADHAIMYRTNAQSRLVEDALMDRGMPYQLAGATRFYDRREIRDMVAYLRLAYNPFDEVALARVINVPPRGVGKKSAQELAASAARHNLPQWTVLQRINQDDPTDEVADFDRRLAKGLLVFHDVLRDLVEARDRLTPVQLLAFCLDRTGYAAWLRDGSAEGEDRWENVSQLVDAAVELGGDTPGEGLGGMLETIALVSDVDAVAEGVDRVTVLTLHAAKGLEFPTVFLTGLEETLLPHSRSADDPEAMAEERRLFYVGITRACRRLWLTYARQRQVFGREDIREPSRFLSDIPTELVRHVDQRGRQLFGGVPRYRDTSWPAAGSEGAGDTAGDGQPPGHRPFAPGEKVVHPTFGRGTVVAVRQSGDDQEVTVAFTGKGVRKLLVSLAALERD